MAGAIFLPFFRGLRLSNFWRSVKLLVMWEFNRGFDKMVCGNERMGSLSKVVGYLD